MHVSEKKTDKVIIDATRSAHGDWQEDNGVRLIRCLLCPPYKFFCYLLGK
jgi:hypothetical protein